MDYSIANAIDAGLKYLADNGETVEHTPNHIEQWSIKALTEYPPADPESRYYFVWGAMSGYNFAVVFTPPSGLNRMEQDAYMAGVVCGENAWSDERDELDLEKGLEIW